ncbi:MAG TPA: glycosyltransferase family 2 protein [Gammaproteobacteria bacterium]|nr:glycosyltransferase family 2 protein [Gammaproteobacteria bacterium]
MQATLDIVIVNWNTKKQLLNCLDSIANTVIKDSFILNKIFIVDNASTDNSLDGILQLDLPIFLIKNSENKGFAYGCNQGAKDSTADYLLFLNPDTLLYADSLAKPLAFMQAPENKTIGIVGVQLMDEEGKVARSCARFPKTSTYLMKMLGLERFSHPHFMKEWDHMDSREVDQIMGAFFLVRKELYNQLQGFDERFFVYLEEVDFSLRAKQRGWTSFYLADAKIFHAGGGSSNQVKAKRLFYSLQSRTLYAFKNFNTLSATTLFLATFLIEPISRCARALLKGSVEQAKETCSAYTMLYKKIPSIFKTICTQK